MVSTVAVVATSCASQQPSPYRYDAAATIACLKKRPEYVPGRFAVTGSLPSRVEMYVSRIRSYPRLTYVPYYGFYLPKGTESFGIFFDGPENETFSQLQTPDVFFLPSQVAARRLYFSEYDYLLAVASKHRGNPDFAIRPETLYDLRRNAVTFWIKPDAPANLRAILGGCLRTERHL